MASGGGLYGFGAFFGLHTLGAVLPPGKDQALVDGLQRLVLCPCRSGAKIDPTSIQDGLYDNDVHMPFKFGLGRPLPIGALF